MLLLNCYYNASPKLQNSDGKKMEKPIYRADHVGSLLRPDSIKNARKAYNETSSINATDLKGVEDQAIEELILMQGY